MKIEGPWAYRAGRRVLGSLPGVVVDIDSTLADTRHRAAHTPHNDPEATWDTYALHCAEDAPFRGTVTLVQRLSSTHRIFVVSSRPVAVRGLTIEWLGRHGVVWDGLRLRAPEDPEDPVEYKVKAAQEQSKVVLGLDDWPPVIAGWAKVGIPGVCVNPMYSEDPNAYFASR